MVLSAAKSLGAFAKVSTALINVIRNGSWTHEANRFDIWIFDQSINCLFITLHDVKYTIRQTSFFEKFGHE